MLGETHAPQITTIETTKVSLKSEYVQRRNSQWGILQRVPDQWSGYNLNCAFGQISNPSVKT
ncbi:hypothetical protein Hanom_Chr09g00864851 [Helianthus anomalus]